MAVQAQYPSNALFFNRTIQDGKGNLGAGDYSSLQPQGDGGAAAFLDHTQILFNHGGGANNPRKRGREVINTTHSPLIISMQSQPPQPSQFIDLTQLHAPPHPQPNPNVVSTGLRLSFGDQQHQHQHQQQQHSLSAQSSQSSPLFSTLAEDLAFHIKQQRDEIDHFLQAQGEQMRRTVVEKRQRYYRALLEAAEETVAKRLREKEAEVEKAVRRNAELEASAAQLSAEAQAWQARARAQEATAATLQAQLQSAIINGGCGGGERVEGNNGLGFEAEDAESAYSDPDRVVETSAPSCKACRKRVASVVLLPCRHLCLCSECDAFALACPLCLAIRSSSVEVFLC